ncbi:MAG: immunity 26/phosphotriesterase HocA family protein [Actinobacteria bacterium]|nr:immunity 26/phosphotriesterase HocA family protein [Actinomycetota bacterium]MCG2802789.1 immunity 26/phosphotriesterase HocA family protein [Cellulomonas sp.]
MKARLELGDVFAVPLDDTRAGIGQVVATYGQGAFYFAIFDLMVHPDDAINRVDEALAAPLLFLAPSLDARLPVPYLTVIGERPVREGLPLPAHREVDAENLVHVVDFSGRRRRPATDDEARRLQNRRFIAPLRLARAMRATAGLEPWTDSYAALIPDEELSSERLFGTEVGGSTRQVEARSPGQVAPRGEERAGGPAPVAGGARAPESVRAYRLSAVTREWWDDWHPNSPRRPEAAVSGA